MRNLIKTICLVVVFGLIVAYISGCSAGVYGGIDTDLYYSDNNAITGKPLGDPWRSRGSGRNRSLNTTYDVGFPVFNGKE